MKIGILEAGRPPEELDTYAGYGTMLKDFITRRDSDGFSFEIFSVLEGHFPQSAQQCDGWMISGSKFGAYENLPWMLTLQELIREIHAAGLPMIGICFGHQIIAAALGGKVVKSDKGWGVGLHDYNITAQAPQWMTTDSNSFTLNAMHQDQVVELPEHADVKVIASSEFCPYAALLYGDSILTFQAHPEFSMDYEIALIELRKTTAIPDDRAQPALEKLNQRDAREDGGLLSGWAVDFFRQHNNQS